MTVSEPPLAEVNRSVWLKTGVQSSSGGIKDTDALPKRLPLLRVPDFEVFERRSPRPGEGDPDGASCVSCFESLDSLGEAVAGRKTCHASVDPFDRYIVIS